LAGKELTIGLYSAERTIVDVFRLRPNIGADVANEALERRLRERGNTRPAVQERLTLYALERLHVRVR
jgi:hypothetical protein